MSDKNAFKFIFLTCALCVTSNVSSAEWYKTETSQLDFNLDAGAGWFNSESSYHLFRTEEQAVTWQEYYLRPKITAEYSGYSQATVYASLGAALTQTSGDGDAAGMTTGGEYAHDWDNALLGFRSNIQWPDNRTIEIDFSVGRQTIVIGDGFLISGDALNFGENDIVSDEFDRGGAYWMGASARSAFAHTAILSLASEQGLTADIFSIKSDNKAQGKARLTGINVEYSTQDNTVAALYFNTESDGQYGIPTRDNLKTLSLRYQGSAGIDNLFLSAEWVKQKQDNQSATAGYVEAGWQFDDIGFKPQVTYRYSSFDEGFDALFYGVNRGLGTWFQGEVAANYAGPFNTNTEVHHIGIKATISDTLSVGGLFYDFNTKHKTAAQNLDATEVNLYAEYFLNDYLLLMPVVGVYNPAESSEQGGSQIGSDSASLYSQLTLFFFY